MNDFEDRVQRLLRENVDRVAGPRRAAPPFVPPVRRGGHGGHGGGGARRAGWVAPLLAAACVALVAGATAGTAQLLSDKGPAATHAPSPPAPTTTSIVPGPTTSPVATPKTSKPGDHRSSGKAGGNKTTNTSPPPNIVMVGGARLALPHGWVARPVKSYDPGLQSWCLIPKSRHDVSDAPEFSPPTAPGCPIDFARYTSHDGLEADQIPGTTGNPPQCRNGSDLQAQYADRPFGGRTADWRYYHLRCNSTHAVLEHYVVLTYPAILMYSMLDSPQVHQAMAFIATHSTLPPQTRPLRMTDRGYVRSVHKTASGIRIAVDRIVVTDKIVNNNSETYTYDVPNRLVDKTPHLGDQVDLETDGRHVTSFFDEK